MHHFNIQVKSDKLSYTMVGKMGRGVNSGLRHLDFFVEDEDFNPAATGQFPKNSNHKTSELFFSLNSLSDQIQS